MFYGFCFNKVPSKAFGIVWMIVDLILCKNRNFCAHSRNFQNSLERGFDLNFSQVIDIQITYVVLMFQNFWSSISMVGVQIITDCSVSDRFCFHCIVCLFSTPSVRYYLSQKWMYLDVFQFQIHPFLCISTTSILGRREY